MRLGRDARAATAIAFSAMAALDSGLSPRSTEGRDEPVDDGSVRERLYPASLSHSASRNHCPEAARGRSEQAVAPQPKSR
jgi:hypothetical protein